MKSRTNNELYSNKSNTLIQGYRWDFKEKPLKIMEFLCSCYMTPYYNADKNSITVGLSDFMRELNSNTQGLSSRDYATFRKTLQDLSDFSIFGTGFNGNPRVIRLIYSIEYNAIGREQYVVCYMSDDFREAMKLHPSGNTKIEFKTICNMSSRFSIKLYNLLKSWQGRGSVTFPLSYLKESLNAKAKSYDNFAKFRQAVLDVAVNEINEKTILKVSYNPIKTKTSAGKVNKVFFTIQEKLTEKTLSTPNNQSASGSERIGKKENLSYDEQETNTVTNALKSLKKYVDALVSSELISEQLSDDDIKLLSSNNVFPVFNDENRFGVSNQSIENPPLGTLSTNSDSFFSRTTDAHSLESFVLSETNNMAINPLKIKFDSTTEKERYVEEYMSRFELNDFCKTILIDIIPEDVHMYNEDHLKAIEAILKVHIPLKDDFGAHINWLRSDQQRRMKNALLIYTTKDWSRQKNKTRTTPFQHYTSNLGYWLQENKNSYQ